MTEFQRLAAEFSWRIDDHAIQDNGVWMASNWASSSAGGENAVSYPVESHDACAAVEDNSFWFKHRNKTIERLVRGAKPAALWEIGAGNGFVARHLQQCGFEVVAVEPGLAGARNAAARGIRQSICGLLEDLKLPAGSIPALGCFDVLEHLEHPEALLAEFHRILAPGGIVAISVPALKSLWSQTDDVAGHFRRYSRKGADADMKKAGFARVRSGYMMMSMVAPLYFLRARPYIRGKRLTQEECLNVAAARLAPGKSITTSLMTAMLRMEFMFSALLPLPCGTSVVGLYRK